MLESPASEEKSTPGTVTNQKKSVERSAEKKSTRDSGIQSKSTEKSAEKKVAKKALVTVFHFQFRCYVVVQTVICSKFLLLEWEFALRIRYLIQYRYLSCSSACCCCCGSF